MANVLCVEGKVVLRPTSSNPRSWAEAPAEAERGRLGILRGKEDVEEMEEKGEKEEEEEEEVEKEAEYGRLWVAHHCGAQLLIGAHITLQL